MRNGLRIILGSLSFLCLISGTLLASETDHPGYTLDSSLINGAAKAVEPAEGTDIEIENKQDLTAVNIKTESPITPYIGAGVVDPESAKTPADVDFEATMKEEPDYRLGAGLGYKLNGSAELDLGYHYSNDKLSLFPNTQPDAVEDGAADDHHISVGLKMAF